MEVQTVEPSVNVENEALFVIETLQFGTLERQIDPVNPGGGCNCNCNSNSNGASEEMLA